MWQHATVEAGIAIAVIRLVAYAIGDDKRWRRFLFLLFLLMAAAALAGWWLFGDGGLQLLLHDFGPAGITPGQRRR
jgi:O-antigen/teichoic acid export membrane protein